MKFHQSIHHSYRPAPPEAPTTVTVFKDLSAEVRTLQSHLFWTQLILGIGLSFSLGMAGVLLYAQQAYIARSHAAQSFQPYRG